MNGYYKPGSNYCVCDECGAKRRSEDVVTRWDNATVCKEKSRCNEERHPQELIRPVLDNTLPAVVTGEPTDSFITSQGTSASVASPIITATAGANGSISPSGATTLLSGGDQTYTITPAAGYVVDTLTVDGVPVAAAETYRFYNVVSNRIIAVTFAESSIEITATAGANGTITPSGVVKVSPGADQYFTIVPDSGYECFAFSINGNVISGAGIYVFTDVQTSQYINAYFQAV